MPAASPPRRWLTVRQACEWLGCSRAQIYRLINSGALTPDGRVGRRHRFLAESLDAYVRANVNGDSMGHLAGEEMQHADQARPAKANRRARDLSRRPRAVPGSREMDRPEDGPKEETRASGDEPGNGGGSQGGPGRHSTRATRYAQAVRRLRDAMERGPR
ncbi:MAG: helix-turn-helix domain-containing protein [Myxococcales bacterium]|nr:helix-turn-helix domain-containing protein [Myxococcales bacterium]